MSNLLSRADLVLPGGMCGHLNPSFMPPGFPRFFNRAQGPYAWAEDGVRYIDLVAGYGTNLLGYNNPEVEAAATQQRVAGDTTSLPMAVMIELAESFTDFVQHADWAMFMKTGTEANTLACAIARAHSGKRIILFDKAAHLGAAPWCNPVRKGLLEEDRAHQGYFDLGDIDSLRRAVAAAGDDLAAIITPLFANAGVGSQELPSAEFAKQVRGLCDQTGAVHIADDIRGGLWLTRDCSWSLIGPAPDLSTWGKALGNGYPIAGIAGCDKFRDAARAVYGSGTYWFGAVPMAAALQTLRIVKERHVHAHIEQLGILLRNGLTEIAARHDFSLEQTGPVQIPQIVFAEDTDFRFGFAFASELLARGVYFHPWHNIFLSNSLHTEDIESILSAADGAMESVSARQHLLQPPTGLVELVANLDH